MQVVVANTNFETVAVIDQFESLLWVDRYNSTGDFELYLSAHSPAMQYLVEDNYCFIRESDYTMIIEGIEIRSDAEHGDKAIITGRSLESILDRRIVWAQTTFDTETKIQTVIKKLIENNITNPSDANRQISNFIFREVQDDYIDSILITGQYTGDTLLDVVNDLCQAYEIGYRIFLDDNNCFVFELYTGTDRTYDQSENPYVIFSPNYENIINSDYLESTKTLKNVTLVAGEGEGKDRKTYTVDTGNTPTGIARRELFTDARDISSEIRKGDGTTKTLSIAEYNKLLNERGLEKLGENSFTKSFAGQVESTILFTYGRDFFMGDIIQIENEFGIAGTARIVEFIRSQDVNGLETYPTFEAINDY